MKIAMLHPALTWRGGAERQLLKLAIELQKRGHEVEIFTCAVNRNCYPELLGQVTVNVVKTPTLGRRARVSIEGSSLSPRIAPRKRGIMSIARNFRNYYYYLPAMLNMGRKIPLGFDAINPHNTPTEWAAFIAKKRLNAPVVWMCNEPPFWFTDPSQRQGLGKINLPLYEWLDRLAVNYVDRIVTISKVAGQRVEQAYGKPFEIVRPGVDLFHEASGQEFRARHGLENSFIILQVGNIAPDKRQIDSLTALHILSGKYKNVKLIFVGAGPTEHLVALSKQWGIEDRVLFLHNCSDEELAQVYTACDVFVFPSHITWGLVVLEAMSASKPVLVSDKAGTSEIIRNGQNGYVFSEPYSKNIALQIENIINNPELGERIGKKAYKFVKEDLSWKLYAENMMYVFKKARAEFKK